MAAKSPKYSISKDQHEAAMLMFLMRIYSPPKTSCTTSLPLPTTINSPVLSEQRKSSSKLRPILNENTPTQPANTEILPENIPSNKHSLHLENPTQTQFVLPGRESQGLYLRNSLFVMKNQIRNHERHL
ncbi:hypothetical protein M0811_07690 [Anaeramoeba ignava]|uniref:Uncharacterized protein n=1 Tax=Anaeramoeba ignava TaxID=1746090 RepID=A0A9Q0LLT9_ANAIG|nr:hypothetical protein M0811_07690 [Anaeramoeba ignava]